MDQNAMKVYLNVSHTQLSVARLYGGCKINGTPYIYEPPQDALIRIDLLKYRKVRTWEEFLEHLKSIA
jgi:hypothetical protein